MNPGIGNAVTLAPAAVGDLLKEQIAPQLLERTGRRAVVPPPLAPSRVGVIGNPLSRRNRAHAFSERVEGEVMTRAPTSQRALAEALVELAAARIELLVVDGGDGTVRDVLTAAPAAFGSAMPTVAVIPSGKTNALAIDLGVPATWTATDARAAFAAGRVETRTPVEITREDGVTLRGFLFGAGGFVRATELAQRTHAIGAFGGIAVGLSVAGAIAQTVFGGRDNPWRAGEPMKMANLRDGTARTQDLYLLLGSTLRRLPLGLRPLGANRAGLNLLAVEAPPRLLPLAAPAILAGREGGWLERAGYHHCHDVPAFQLDLRGGFILDGEAFAAESITVRTGAPIRFVTP
ncbi:diacylglycerol kinase family protein [Sphingomonas sp. BK235]|uniref:diacylglycerol kinase family protein n=1 Tax=Sphingomonas sp. BK235 TaxID=2512131 RepID=UPI001050D852|nr:diacylglycerol kinase family protein [Sphingomonas sp. BK235]TCP36667.1 diacylglycerol kinase-like protein [Sphingomonas sp. BK235]